MMAIENAIDLLEDGVHMPVTPHTVDEMNKACMMACDALRLYSQSFQEVYSVNAAIADHYRDIGVPMERLDELAAADKAGRLVILPDVACTNADGEKALRRAMWDCNYQNNGVTRFTADAIAEKLCREVQKVRMSVKTPLGDIMVEPSADSDNPGVWISLHRDGEKYEHTLALVEYTTTEADCGGPVLVTRVWGDARRGEYTDRIIHSGFGKDGHDR